MAKNKTIISKGVFVKDGDHQWYFVPLEMRADFYASLEAIDNAMTHDEAEVLLADFIANYHQYRSAHPVHYVLENPQEF